MNDLQLREFRTRAEELVDLPDLAELEGRGRRLHRRRIALGAGLAAAVLAVTGGLVVARSATTATRRRSSRRTTERPPRCEYPGPVMETLDAGTYLLQPSWEDTAPRARLTLPAGWNAWEGPNRFDGDLETTDLVRRAARRWRWTRWPRGRASEPQSDDVVGDSRAELVGALRSTSRRPGPRRRGAGRDVRLPRHAPPD